MSNTILCQILEHENLLRENGIAEEQIKTQTKFLAQIIENSFATREDLKDSQNLLSNEINTICQKLKNNIDFLRSDLARIEEHIKIVKQMI